VVLSSFKDFEDHILLRGMTGIWIVLEVVDDREDDLVIRAIAAVEHTQLPFKDAIWAEVGDGMKG
jgi:hypothetical protein